MPGKKLPDNWDEDTRFDGPEHWGMEQRWKSLFPKRGVRVDDSSSDSDSSSSSSSSSSRKNDSLEESVRAKDTVDISKDNDDDDEDDDDDDDGFGAPSSEGDSHDATGLSIGVARTRKNIPETAPAPPDDERDRRIASSNRPSNSTKVSRSSSSSSSRKARREEAKATARRWRQGTKDTEPASSCSSRAGVGRRVRPGAESGTPVRVSREEFSLHLHSSSSEGEEEFDESEANITGHERSPGVAKATAKTTLRRRKERKGGGRHRLGESPSPTSAERNGRSSGKEKGRRRADKANEGGRAASPLACDDSDSDSSGGFDSLLASPARVGQNQYQNQNHGIESIGSDSSDGGDGDFSDYASSAAGSGNEGCRSGRGAGGGGGGNRGSKDSRRQSLSSPSHSHSRPHSHTSARGKGKRQHPTHAKGSVRREGGRRRDRGAESHSHRSSSSSNQSKGSKGGTPSSSTQASKRPTQSGSKNKKLRKVVPAKGDEHGWISKGSGGGGGSSGGGARGRSNPVSSFQAPQTAARKNQERGLTQSKIKFPVVLDE